MKVAWRCAVLLVAMMLAGCSILPNERDDSATRASEAMAPANPNRGTKTIRVVTRTAPGLEVRLVTFYSQFQASQNVREQMPRGGRVAAACWWSKSSLLQEERFYYNRVFYYPVGSGTSIQNLPLDEIVPGTCHIGITGIGYEVTYKTHDGESAAPFLVRFDIAIEESGTMAAEAYIQCKEISLGAGKTSALRCSREQLSNGSIHLGPLATSGAALTLNFRLENAASQ